jgi:hypothetical protein
MTIHACGPDSNESTTTLRKVDDLPPAVHPDTTFVRVTDCDWTTFTRALTIACPVCPAKAKYPCGLLVAGYHRPRLRKANRRAGAKRESA